MSKLNQNSARLRVDLLQHGESLGSFLSEAGEDQMILGSSKKADLVVPNQNVSHVHAMLRLKNKQIFLYDLGSAEGTFVSGKRIIESELKHGSHFRVGSIEMRVGLLEDFAQDSTDNLLFWNAKPAQINSTLCVDINHLVNGEVQNQYKLVDGQKLEAGRKEHAIPLCVDSKNLFTLKNDSLSCELPQGFTAEVYDYNNKILRSANSGTLQISPKEKLLLKYKFTELHLYWRNESARTQRLTPDLENKILQKNLLLSLALAALFIASTQLFRHTEETLENITKPESSYLRVSTEGGSPAPAQNAEAAGEKSEAPAAAPAASTAKTPSKALSSVSSALSNILKKSSNTSDEAIAQAVSKNGQQTARAISSASSNMQKQSIQTGAIGSGINADSVSKGLQGSGGNGSAAKGLNGFAKGGTGIGAAGGTGIGGSGGSGFNLNVGGEEAEAIGGLDKALIAAVVQANLGQIKHCYEKQLLIDSNLYGKVVAEWIIDKTGSVSKSGIKKTTMNNANVENCIAGKIKNWKFPQPKGGGNVQVSYPFLFKSMN